MNERRHFLFRSDELDVPTLVRHLTDRLVPMGFASLSNLDVIATAFHEALVNCWSTGTSSWSRAFGDLFAEEDPTAGLRQKLMADPEDKRAASSRCGWPWTPSA